jgi:hypothetical protein
MTKAAIPLFLLTTGITAQAQTPDPPSSTAQFNVVGPHITMAGVPAGGVQIISREFSLHGGKPVTGAPYSAEQITEHIQTLPDGNRIVNTTTTHLYRDSQGRTRTEVTMPARNGAEPPMTATIDDVVTGAMYTLQPATKTAFKMPAPRPLPAPPGSASETVPFPVALPAPPPPPPLPAGSGPMVISFTSAMPKPDVKTQDLGTQPINGVSATGTRITSTIPAGAIGNEMPIEIVSETWYSPELKMVVKSVQNDPRIGQTTVTVTNIDRSVPDPSLFQVPSDYTLSDHAPNVTLFRTQQKPQTPQ